MKRSLLLAAIATAILSCNAVAHAQSPNVALLDLGYIFKNHAGFNAAMERMRGDVQAAETKIRNDRDALVALVGDLRAEKEFKKGTKEYNQLEQDLTRREADIQIEMNVKKKEFMERESRIYYNVYKEVMAAVSDHCQRNGILVVMRFAGDPVDPTDPQSILKDINKQVLHWDPSIDITPHVLRRVSPPATGGKPQRNSAPPRSR
ncbi:MAG: OmpH family outer membrane protein [Pirellulales bacterium]